MLDSLPLPLLLVVFAAGAAAVWFAGVHLSQMADTLSRRLHLGSALGGLILLAIATNLPEIAITVSAAISDNLDLAVGNILGGIAIQTVVLVLIDGVGIGRKAPLTYQADSLVPVLEGALVIAVLIVAIMGSQLPLSLVVARVTPEDALIALCWATGLWLVGRASKGLPWQQADAAGDEAATSGGSTENGQRENKPNDEPSTARAAVVFAIAAIVTLGGGVALERSGEAIATGLGMSGVLFGATLLAAATSLPEISTGLAAVKLGDDQLAISDVFGGNAFLPVLFLLATLISGKPVLPQAQETDIYLAGLGILLTVVYLFGLIFRSRRQVWRLGIDSLVVLILYAVGLAGLVAIATG